MFWFDKRDPRGLFVDKRRESHTLTDISSKGGIRELVVDPDLQCDFTALPFPDASFPLVVFDPPHLERNGSSGWVGLKYGTLKGDWRETIRSGFSECFRVLKPDGTLVFKWCADEIPVSQILALTPERPLFGHKSGKRQQTHWITFLKQNDKVELPPPSTPQNDHETERQKRVPGSHKPPRSRQVAPEKRRHGESDNQHRKPRSGGDRLLGWCGASW